MGGKGSRRRPKSSKISPMSGKEREIVEIVDVASPLSDLDGTPLRPIFCLRKREDMKLFEEKEECFILEFDPNDCLETGKLSVSKNLVSTDAHDVLVVAEKGQVACRDYPHSRYFCATYPFDKTPHERHCDLCYCYVCDSAAPCKKWTGATGHCHAINNAAWNHERKTRRERLLF